ARSAASALLPSSASAVLVKPRSPSRFLTMRRIVEKSSTIRIRMFLFIWVLLHQKFGPRVAGLGTRDSQSGQRERPDEWRPAEAEEQQIATFRSSSPESRVP